MAQATRPTKAPDPQACYVVLNARSKDYGGPFDGRSLTGRWDRRNAIKKTCTEPSVTALGDRSKRLTECWAKPQRRVGRSHNKNGGQTSPNTLPKRWANLTERVALKMVEERPGHTSTSAELRVATTPNGRECHPPVRDHLVHVDKTRPMSGNLRLSRHVGHGSPPLTQPISAMIRDSTRNDFF